MTLEELENTLPWGLHDAHVESLTVDWTRAEVVLVVRVAIGEHQETDQRARIIVGGLDYCSIEPPRARTPLQPGNGVWVQPDAETAEVEGQPTPAEGCFLHRFFVSDLNSCFYVAARDARLEWVETVPQPSRSQTRALFPGEEIPDPSE
jgi:hypothetical protein